MHSDMLRKWETAEEKILLQVISIEVHVLNLLVFARYSFCASYSGQL